MLKKGTKLYSILKFKCPRCQEGDFFTKKGNFRLKDVTKIYDHCSNCNQKYMLEPSFYYGAMYVAYGLTVALSILIFLISNLLFHFDLLASFFAIIVILIVMTPINLRLSRMIWINMFISYKEKKQ